MRRILWLVAVMGVIAGPPALAQTPAKPAAKTPPPATTPAKPAAPAPAPAKSAPQTPAPAKPVPQAPASTKPEAPATAPAQTVPAAPPQTPQAPPAAEAYTYNPEGRRDPFVSLLLRGTDMHGPRPEGVGGLLIGEITIKGIVKSPKGFVAMIAAPDNKTFIVHVNDRLFDGSVKAIAPDAVVFSQEVNDPLSLVKQREVRKPLRALQEGK